MRDICFDVMRNPLSGRRDNFFARVIFLKTMALSLRLQLSTIILCFVQLVVIPGAEIEEDDQTHRNIPGHLEPLGSRSQKHSLEQIHSFLNPAEFFTNYVAQVKPVLIKGGAKFSPAYSKWTDEYFLSLPEASDFNIVAEQRKKEIRTFPPREISFVEFVTSYGREDIYMVNGVPPFLQKDVMLPPPLLCEDIVKDMLVDTVMWFSSGGTKSVLHNDDVDNINCLFSGTKELLFIDYKYKNKVPIDFPAGGYSGVDVDRVDLIKYPSLRDVEYFNVTMEPGDCLYIPFKWFHQVRSYNRNIAVNVWWKHKADFIPQNCSLEPNQTIDKFTFSALEQKDDEEEPPNFIEHLRAYVDKGQITFEEFEDKFKRDPDLYGATSFQWNDEFTSVVEKIFQLIDMDQDKFLSTHDIERLDEVETMEHALENELARMEDMIEDQSEAKQQEQEGENEKEIPTTKDEL